MSSSVQPIETDDAANGDKDISKEEKKGGYFFLTSTLFTANISHNYIVNQKSSQQEACQGYANKPTCVFNMLL